LVSALSNWETKNEGVSMDEKELIVQTISVDSGRMLMRVHPAPQGRAHRVRKRSNHVTIVIGESNTTENSSITEVKEVQ
jgi:large subunit ribosomal protein L22